MTSSKTTRSTHFRWPTTWPSPCSKTAEAASCFGSANGAISIDVSGGTPGYTFAWAASGFASTNEDLTNLQSGVYALTVTDANGCTAVNGGILVDQPLQLVVNAQVTPATCAYTGDGAVDITPGGGTPAYNFNWSDGAGFSAATEDINGLNTGIYTVTITDANGCTLTASFTVFSENPAVTMNAPADQAVCHGHPTAAIDFSGSDPALVFNWTNDQPSIGLAASGTGDIASFIGQNFSSAPVVATITVTPGLNGCSGPAQTFTITVNPIPTMNPVPNQTVCAGSLTQPIALTGLVPGTVYGWSYTTAPVGQNIGLPSAGTGDIAPFVALNSTYSPIVATFTVEPDAFGCLCSSMSFAITVNPKPAMNQPANRAVCAGSAVTAINFSGLPAGLTFLWTNSEPSIGLAASGTGNIAGFISQNNTGANLVATITVTPVLNDCPGTPKVFTITVKPTPQINFCSNIQYCHGEMAMPMPFVSTVPGATVSWTNSKPSIGLTASGTGGLPAFTATNTGTSNVIAVIGATGSLNGCTGATTSFTITVKPAPKVNTVANKPPVCHGATISATTFSGTSGASFHWTNSAPSIGLAASGVGNIPAFAGQNTGTTTVVATVTVTPYKNGCWGAPRTFTITVKPMPTVNDFVYPTEACPGDGLPAIALSSPVSGATLTWTNSKTSIGLAASGAANIPAFTAANTSGVNTVALIKITPKANGCTGPILSKTLTVKPLPTVNQPANQFVLAGDPTLPVVFTGTGLGVQFSWTNDNPDIGLATSGTGDILAFFAQNNTGGSLVANIVVTPSAQGCTGASKTFSITVMPPSAKPGLGDRAGEWAMPRGIELFQNRPNPFVDETSIEFYLPERMAATLSVFDATGKLLWRTSDVFEAGHSKIILPTESTGAAGLLFCRLDTPLGSASRRMLKTR